MIPRRFFWAGDFVIIGLALWAAFASWPALHRFALELSTWALPLSVSADAAAGLPPFSTVARMLLPAGLAVIFCLENLGAYAPLLTQSRTRIILSPIAAAVGAAGLITLLLFFEKQTAWSRLFLVAFIGYGAFALASVRMSLRHYLLRRREAGFYRKNVLLVGPREGVQWLVHYFARNAPSTEYKISGYLAIKGEPDDLDPGVPFLGFAERLGETLISQPVDEVLAVDTGSASDWLRQVVETCDGLGIFLCIIPRALLSEDVRTLRYVSPLPILHLPGVVLSPPHFDSDALFFKRVVDIVASTILLIVLSPLFLVIALVIKISDRRSPVFYRWNVVGRNGTRFEGYKFTTMFADADERRKELLDRNEMTGPVFKIKEDPRVTPIGRFLRKYSLNELPQLWSVLKGDMSLVGPRPAFPHELEGYGFWHKRKLSIRPGITCLWQVRGRNQISNFDDWVKMDLEYIDNWSLWLDFKILARTAWAVLAGTGS